MMKITENKRNDRVKNLPPRAFAKPEKLFLVMPSMHQMKLSPLCRSQRTQKRMVEQVDPAPEAHFTLRDDRIHRHNLCPELASHLLHRQAFRLRDRRCFASGGHVTQSHDDQGQYAMRHGSPRGQRLSACHDSLESLDRSGVGEIQMFQHLRRAPLARGMPAQLLAGHAFHRRLQRLFQLVQAEIHGTTLALRALQVDKLRNGYLLDRLPAFASFTPALLGQFILLW
jgi:hypothetical protein